MLKSHLDSRTYSTLRLPNGLRVALVHDEHTELAAAALCVDSGAMCDQAGRPEGLAHFCEHMVFVASEDHPETGKFKRLVRARGGRMNASTSLEETKFQFEVEAGAFPEVLDVWSSFFKNPLFAQDAVELELAAVDSEHQKNRTSDARRVLNLMRHLADEGHPFATFSTGSFETLRAGPALVAHLKEFHAAHYVAHRMCLALTSSLSLERMEELARSLFSPVRSAPHSAPLVVGSEPWSPAAPPRLLRIEPFKDTKELHVCVPLPISWADYLDGAARLVYHYLGHEGEGSLLYVLRLRRWATALSAGPGDSTRTFELARVKITLTHEGMAHWKEVLALVFAYVEMLRNVPVVEHERSHQEESRISSNAFEHGFQKGSGLSTVLSIIRAMTRGLHVEHWLNYGAGTTRFDASSLARFLELFSPARCAVLLVDPEPLENPLVDPHYDTRYSIEELPALPVLTGDLGLRLPRANPYIAENFTVSPIVGEPELLAPVQIAPDIWVLEPCLPSPLASIRVDIFSPVSYLTPRHAVLCSLYGMMIMDALQADLYDALLADLNLSVSYTHQGLHLSLSGYSEKLPVLFDRGLQAIFGGNDALRWDQFEVVLLERTRFYKNYALQTPPFRQALYYESAACTVPKLTIPQYAAEENVTAAELRRFIGTFHERVGFQALFSNMPMSQGKKLATLLSAPRTLTSAPLLQRWVHLRQPTTVAVVSPDPQNSGFVFSYHLGSASVPTCIKGEVIRSLISGDLSNELRFRQNLGYVVLSSLRTDKAVRLLVIVQSEKNVAEVREAVQSFLSSFEFQESAIEKATRALLSSKREPWKRVSHVTRARWAEISSQRLDFDRRRRELEFLEQHTLTPRDLERLMEQHQLLSVHVLGGGLQPQEGDVRSEELPLWKNRQMLMAAL